MRNWQIDANYKAYVKLYLLFREEEKPFARFYPHLKLRQTPLYGNVISRETRRREGARSFLLSRGRAAMGKGSSNGPEFGVIRLGGCPDVN